MTIKAEKPKTQWPLEFTPRADIVKIATPKPAASAPADERESYYGVPLLKRPKWRWEIALYFFFEGVSAGSFLLRSEEHTSELQSRFDLVCRLLLEKKK